MDLRGVVDLLGSAIYSSPRVYLRELLQNSLDAVHARSRLDPTFRSRGIVITPADAPGDVFTITDDGIGLSESEIDAFLATVGRSSKRDVLNLPREDYLGQFGIGLLSAFMVADEIVVTTRSADGSPAVRWVGRADGTYSCEVLDALQPAIGTTVALTPRGDEATLLATASVLADARRYARYAATPIGVRLPRGGTELVNEDPVFATAATDDEVLHSPQVRALGEELLGRPPFAVIPLDVPATGTRGVAFVLPTPPAPNVRTAHHVHLGGLLVSESANDLAPPWAFFARVVVTSTGLAPTASREHLVDDDRLALTRAVIGQRLLAWLATVSADPIAASAFVGVHHLALKSLLVHEDAHTLNGNLHRALAGLVPLETSRGVQTVHELARGGGELAVANTTDQFRQVVALTGAQRVVVNGSHTYDLEVLARLADLYPGVTVRPISADDVVGSLAVVAAQESAAAADLEARATAAMAAATIDGAASSEATAATATVAVVRVLQGTVPALMVTDPDVVRAAERSKARRAAPSRWARMLDAMEDAASPPDATVAARLVLNWTNPLVRQLSSTHDPVVFPRVMSLLHLQAILLSGRPLTARESAELTGSLSDLMVLSLPTTDLEDHLT